MECFNLAIAMGLQGMCSKVQFSAMALHALVAMTLLEANFGDGMKFVGSL